MIKKSKIPSLLIIPLVLVLTACQTPDNSPSTSSVSPEKEYTQKDIQVIGFDLKDAGNATCRFYENGIKLIPYLDINSYYEFLLDKTVQITHKGNEVYNVKTYLGEADIDVKNDILYSADYNQFINTTIYRSNDSRNVYYDGAPYLKVGEFKSEEEVTPTTIDFKQYKIDFIYDDDKLWAPLITWSDMFKGVTMIQSFYNGDKIYLYDSNVANEQIFYQYEYLSHMGETFYKNGVRDAALAELTYYEMCFVIDYYYGFPTRSPLDSLIKEHGLDYALENYSSSSRLTKEYLLSTDVNKYIAGMYFLGDLLQDGGHTVMQAGAMAFYESNILSHYGDKDKVHSYLYDGKYEYLPAERIDYSEYIMTRTEITNNQRFIYNDDTLVYAFNSFGIDFIGWEKYYSGQTSELPKDTIGNFHRGIELAKENNIKNFVLDISINGGGFGDVVMYLIGAMTGAPTMYYYDHIDKRNNQQNYFYDLNLDGQFNEEDETKIADLNFAILTSEISFSCGNLLPALAKGEGIMVLGDKSGGGACAVLDNCSMEGLYYRSSSFVHLTDKNFNSIDSGIAVNYNLLYSSGQKNIADMYNLDLISEKVSEFYSN